jgi:hypothetical protein
LCTYVRARIKNQNTLFSLGMLTYTYERSAFVKRVRAIVRSCQRACVSACVRECVSVITVLVVKVRNAERWQNFTNFNHWVLMVTQILLENRIYRSPGFYSNICFVWIMLWIILYSPFVFWAAWSGHWADVPTWALFLHDGHRCR